KASYAKFAQDGQFHMVNLLDSSGFLTQLKPEERKTLEDIRYRYAQRAKADYVSQYMAEDLAALGAVARVNPGDTKSIAEAARKFNAKFRNATGIDEDVVDVQRTVETAAVTLFNDQKTVMEQHMKAEQRQANAIAGFSAGFGSSSYADTGMSATEADSAFQQLYRTSEDQVGLLIKNALAPRPFVSPTLSGLYKGMVAGSMTDTLNDGMRATYLQWKKLNDHANGGQATAMAYFGEYHSQFQAMDTMIQAGIPDDIAYQRTFVAPPPKNPELTKQNRKVLENALDQLDKYEGPRRS